MKRFILAIAIVLTTSAFTGCCTDFGCDACAGNNYMFNYSSSGGCCGGTPW